MPDIIKKLQIGDTNLDFDHYINDLCREAAQKIEMLTHERDDLMCELSKIKLRHQIEIERMRSLLILSRAYVQNSPSLEESLDEAIEIPFNKRQNRWWSE